MRKLILMIGATVVVCSALFAWSHSGAGSVQASPAVSINPIDMMLTYKAPLPVEQWDAI